MKVELEGIFTCDKGHEFVGRIKVAGPFLTQGLAAEWPACPICEELNSPTKATVTINLLDPASSR